MMKRGMPGVLLGLFVVGGLLAPSVSHAFGAPLVRTPMVGRAWQTGAAIWAGTAATFGDSSTEKLILRARLATACETCWVATVDMVNVDTGGGFRSWKGMLEGLQPGTRYRYGIFVSGQTTERGGYFFTTEPLGKARFKVGVASCMNGEVTPSQPSFSILHEQLNTGEPNIQLLVGDNMYTTQNPPTKDHYWFKYFQQRNVLEFSNVYRAFPTFAVWDDHDYGPNNEDGSFAQKDIARAAYTSLYPHPPLGGDGIYHKFTWGGDLDGTGSVEFFMMDSRWGRNCPLNPPAGHVPAMYGATQFSWLKTVLLASKATFKVIVNGSTLDSGCWGPQKQAIFDYIAANNIGGVLFVTGDIHRSEINERLPTGRDYSIWELTSSGIGITSSTSSYSFGIMEFDMTLADPTVTLKVIRNPQKRTTLTGEGVTVIQQTVSRSTLQ